MSRMNEIIKFLHEYLNKDLDKCGFTEGDTIGLSKAICLYAHRNQKRENGHQYIEHPIYMDEQYKKLLGIYEKNVEYLIDYSLLDKLNIPNFGVVELCCLHDVIEDSDFTIDQIEELFEEINAKNYFEEVLKEPLLLITHDKSQSYDDYINKVIQNPISAFVKLLDLNDNSYIFTLTSFEDDKYERMIKYIKAMKTINDKYHFIENIYYYRNHKNKFDWEK